MNANIKRIWDIITTVLVAMVVILAFALVGVRLIGFQVYTVLSGSMEPAYHTGSLIYVKDVEYTELEVGDAITFMMNEETVATHRIVEVVTDPKTGDVEFRTKGDANNAIDGKPVHYKNVIGKPVFSIPKMGYFASYIQSPPGMYVAMAAGAFLLILTFLPDLIMSGKKKEKLPQEENAE